MCGSKGYGCWATPIIDLSTGKRGAVLEDLVSFGIAFDNMKASVRTFFDTPCHLGGEDRVPQLGALFSPFFWGGL